MAEFVRRHSLFLSSVALIIGSFQLMSSSIENPNIPKYGAQLVNSSLSPIEEIHSDGISSIKGQWERYLWLVGVEEENKTLRERVKKLEAENSKLTEFSHENKRLRSLLNYSKIFNHAGVAGTVIGRDPSNWIRSLTIDIGRQDQINEGLAVVDGHAVVGLTTVVSPGSSRVLLLTDSTSAIDAVVQRTRAPGIVEADAEQKLSMRYVVKEDDVAVGDRVITSGLGGVFPKGVLIGVVTKVESDGVGLFQEVELSPSANLNHLENVLVLTKQYSPKKEKPND